MKFGQAIVEHGQTFFAIVDPRKGAHRTECHLWEVFPLIVDFVHHVTTINSEVAGRIAEVGLDVGRNHDADTVILRLVVDRGLYLEMLAALVERDVRDDLKVD